MDWTGFGQDSKTDMVRNWTTVMDGQYPFLLFVLFCFYFILFFFDSLICLLFDFTTGCLEG